MYLGLDIGTSAVKAVLVDEAGKAVDSASAQLTAQSPKVGWSEQAPDTWWSAVQSTCADLGASSELTRVAAIGLSGQMHGAVCLDEQLTPIRPAILWNDGRSTIGEVAGAIPMPGFTAPKLLWLAQNEPEHHARIKHILLPKDYIRLRLTGALATDMADAAGTHWFDQKNRTWSQALCDISATKHEWLPDCIEGSVISGHVTKEAAATLGLSVGIPVAGGGGDAAAGAVGIGAVEDGDAFISLGTSGQLFVVTDSYRPNPDSAIHAYAHCIPQRWFQMAAMLNGASPLAWWATASGTSIPDLLVEAEIARDETTPLFLPYLTGERTPHNDANIRGSFYGLARDTGRAEMTRAVLDSIAYTFCDARDALAQAGTTIVEPAVIGGGARSDLLLQTISDALAVPLKRYEDAETGPAFGAARLAMVALGKGNIEAIATAPAVDRVFTHNPQRSQRHGNRLIRFRELYHALKPFAANA